MKETFEAEYEVQDGYVGGKRPKYFSIYAEDLEDEMSDEDLKDWYFEQMDAHFQENVYPYSRTTENFVKWAREKINERASRSS